MIIKKLLEHGFYLFCVSPYRFNKDISDIEYYRKNKKIKLFELNNSNLKSFLFNRNQNDELILCVKDKSIISKMNIF